MKILLLPILFHLLVITTSFAQPNDYWAETTSLDSFEIIENGESRLIKSYRADKTKFEFNCMDPAKTIIRMHCKSCEVTLTLKLNGIPQDAYTDWIKLSHNQGISVKDCFDKYPEKSALSKIFSSASEILYDFWSSLRGGRTARSITPALKSGSPKPDDVKLEFLMTDYHYYFTPEDFTIYFRNYKGYPVKSIYIISHEGMLLFHAGDREILGDIFDLSGKSSPSVESVLNVHQSKEEERTYELNSNRLQRFLFDKLKPEEVYQLGIELENDASDHNPYLFNFQFFIPKELERMKQFFDRERN